MEHDVAALIRARAFEIWELEGCPSGRERIHWLRAEAEIREKVQPRTVEPKAKLYRVIANDKIPPIRTRMTVQAVPLRFPKRA